MITVKTIEGEEISINPVTVGIIEVVKKPNEFFKGIYLVTLTGGKKIQIKAKNLKDAHKILGLPDA